VGLPLPSRQQSPPIGPRSPPLDVAAAARDVPESTRGSWGPSPENFCHYVRTSCRASTGARPSAGRRPRRGARGSSAQEGIPELRSVLRRAGGAKVALAVYRTLIAARQARLLILHAAQEVGCALGTGSPTRSRKTTPISAILWRSPHRRNRFLCGDASAAPLRRKTARVLLNAGSL